MKHVYFLLSVTLFIGSYSIAMEKQSNKSSTRRRSSSAPISKNEFHKRAMTATAWKTV